jgi:phosphoglycerate kinase
MKIGIIGLGIVGSAIKYGFEKLGHTISFFDIKYKDSKIEAKKAEIQKKLAECDDLKSDLQRTRADFENYRKNTEVVDVKHIPEGWQGLDAGPKSLANFKEVILASKTILWNGPLGVFEMPTFAKGTIALGDYIAEATANGAFSLVGGGDSVAAVKQFGFEHKVSYVSTGGGAMLEMLEGRTLPGIAAILE